MLIGIFDDLHIRESELKDIFDTIGPTVDTIRIREATQLYVKEFNSLSHSIKIPNGFTWIMWVCSMENDTLPGDFALTVYTDIKKTHEPHMNYPKQPPPTAAGRCGCVVPDGLFPIVFREGHTIDFGDSDGHALRITRLNFLYTSLQKGVDY